MKTIKINDIADVPASDVEPGMIIAEGIIIRVRPGSRGYMYDVPSGETVWAEPDQHVQVYAVLAEGMVDAVNDAYRESLSRLRVRHD